MERLLILLLALAATGLGTTAAVLRPGVFQLGQSTPPVLGSGVTWRGGRQGERERLLSARPRGGDRSRWERFQGRGPGSAK